MQAQVMDNLQIPADTCGYLRKSQIVTWTRHDPWEYLDPDPWVKNLRVFFAGTWGLPVDDPHLWWALLPSLSLRFA